MQPRHTLIAGLAASLTVVSAIGLSTAADPPPGPEGLVGFSGQVRGVVVKQRERGGIDFKVGRVLQTWGNNEAERPQSLKGRTVPVGPAWVRRGEGGKWQPVEKHLQFLRSLEPGEELTLEIRHAEREHFAILELSAEQRERAARRGEGRHDKHDRRDERDGREGRDAEIAELRREIERLRAENRELRKDR